QCRNHRRRNRLRIGGRFQPRFQEDDGRAAFGLASPRPAFWIAPDFATRQPAFRNCGCWAPAAGTVSKLRALKQFRATRLVGFREGWAETISLLWPISLPSWLRRFFRRP